MKNGFVKSPRIVMPDLIRHPEPINLLDSGFRRNDGKTENPAFYEFIIINKIVIKYRILSIEHEGIFVKKFSLMKLLKLKTTSKKALQ